MMEGMTDGHPTFDAPDPLVCALCGVTCTLNSRDAWIHTDALPREFDVHDVISPMPHDAWLREKGTENNLKHVATDMLIHHATLHPTSECEWSRRLALALRA